MRRLAIFVGLLALVACLFLVLNERTRMTVLGSSGTITSGQKFGVSIGDSYPVASEAIERAGFEVLNVYSLRDGEKVATPGVIPSKCDSFCRIVYEDKGFANGLVTLTYRSGAITEIRWGYDLIF